MQYINWNQFTWLSDDSFLWRTGEFLDCLNIDVLENSWYVDGAKTPSITEIWTSIGSAITSCKDWASYPVFCNTSWTYWGFLWFNSSTSDWWQNGAYLVETIWTTSLPVAYWFKNWYIRQQTFNGSWNPFNNVITTNVPSWIPTYSCIGAGRIYFAVLDKIYILNTTIDPTTTLSTVNATPANSTIPFGYTIKYMYIYMDVMNVVATDWKDTTIYQLTETTTDVWWIRYYHKIRWVVCIGASWEWNSMYWFSNNAIYQSNWVESQKVKVYWKNELSTTFSNSAICTLSEGILKIADGTTLWEYWHKKPWYNPVLIKKSRVYSITALDSRIEVMYYNTKVYWWRDNYYISAPFTDYSITSLPYSGQDFLAKKEGIVMRIWHILPAYSTYTSISTLCSITVKVLTDEMEQKWVSTWVTIATITTPSTWVAERYTDISSSEIITAINWAWYNPDFHYIKIIIEWARWDLAITSPTYGINLWRKTPKFFWIRLLHNEINKWL